MTNLEILESQLNQLQTERTKWSISMRDNLTARSRAGKKARNEAEQQLKRIDRQIDDVNKKILQLQKQSTKVEKVEIKQESKNLLASQGIDPSASMWGSISSLGQSASSAVTGVFGASSPQAKQSQKKQ